MRHIYLLLLGLILVSIQCKKSQDSNSSSKVTFATFNVSMEAENYLGRDAKEVSSKVLINQLAGGDSPHIQNIAQIIQAKRPDIILLNEFDYIENPKKGVEQFIDVYLKESQGDFNAIDYPYYYYSTSNTGIETPFDLNGDGKKEGSRNDAFGYGRYPGHYGMVLLSKFPIDRENIRTFQNFKWKDMPEHLEVLTTNDEPFYSDKAWQKFRLSSKSHWDVPIRIDDKTIHVLASHPTPPGFDGKEDRNGKRNHDEIRFWQDYIDKDKGSYIYDDEGNKGSLGDESFVITGDLNASPNEGDAINSGIKNLLDHPQVNDNFTPSSKGGKRLSPDNLNGKYHTASWKLRADYVLPSTDLKVSDHGIFWPTEGEPLHKLMQDREASSDHRMVWVSIALDDKRQSN